MDPSKVELKGVTFTAGQGSKDYKIEGKMTLKNKTSENILFQIDSGQLFGCSNANTSQPVVVRKFNG